MKSLRFVFLTILVSHAASAATWYVDKDNTGTEDGTSWVTAFKTIQPAIDAAFVDGGGDVWVAEGNYGEPRTSVMHDPPVDTGSVVMKEGVHLYGGFVGNETSLDQRDWENQVTVLDGSSVRWTPLLGH